MRVRARTPQMLACCPTDDQAEAMIPRSIPTGLITGVAVASEGQAKTEEARFRLLKLPQIDWIIAPALFTGDWSSAVRRGRRPVEKHYVPLAGGSAHA